MLSPKQNIKKIGVENMNSDIKIRKVNQTDATKMEYI